MIVYYVRKVLHNVLQTGAFLRVQIFGAVEQDLELARETLAQEVPEYRRHFLVEFPPGVLENGTQHEEVESLIDIGKVVAAFAKPEKKERGRGKLGWLTTGAWNYTWNVPGNFCNK